VLCIIDGERLSLRSCNIHTCRMCRSSLLQAAIHISRYTVRFPMRAGFGGLPTWWQQEIGSGHSTWALTVHVRHPMCVRCKELVCPCTPVLEISVKANDHLPPITSHTYTIHTLSCVTHTECTLHCLLLTTWLHTLSSCTLHGIAPA
jgi:hypothetical protein